MISCKFLSLPVIPFCSGRGTSVGSASELLGPVRDGRERAAELGSPDHRELQLLRHPWEKYELAKLCALFCSSRTSLGTVDCFIVMFVLFQWACWDLWPLQSTSSIKPPPPAPCLSAWSPLWHPGKHASTGSSFTALTPFVQSMSSWLIASRMAATFCQSKCCGGL